MLGYFTIRRDLIMASLRKVDQGQITLTQFFARAEQIEDGIVNDVSAAIANRIFPADLRRLAREIIDHWRSRPQSNPKLIVFPVPRDRTDIGTYVELIERLSTVFRDLARRGLQDQFRPLAEEQHSSQPPAPQRLSSVRRRRA